jgi:hypothetical protein
MNRGGMGRGKINIVLGHTSGARRRGAGEGI